MATKLPGHFSDLIRDEFHARSLKNPSYSLRAFSRDIGLSSGTLSDILKKKTGISEEKARSVAAKLFKHQEEQDFFCKLTKANCSRSELEKNKAEAQLWNYNTKFITTSHDLYNVLANWYDFALAELVNLKDFRNDPHWISQKLGITPQEVEKSIERLLSVRLLSVVNGNLVTTYDFFANPDRVLSDGKIKLHKQALEKASDAITSQTIEERYISTAYLRVRKSDFPLIAQRFREFARELIKDLESGEDHDSVYTFAVQFFRADKD